MRDMIFANYYKKSRARKDISFWIKTDDNHEKGFINFVVYGTEFRSSVMAVYGLLECDEEMKLKVYGNPFALCQLSYRNLEWVNGHGILQRNADDILSRPMFYYTPNKETNGTHDSI